MADSPPHSRQHPGAPRWVKVFGVIALVLVVLLTIALLVGGEHGPGRHTSSGGAAGSLTLMAAHAQA